jgi:hypothetical protein
VNNPADEIPQSEKRRVMENDRAHAEASADDERGGRFASVNKASVSRLEAATLYPRRPASQWGGVDPIPDEPPLGYEIDQQEATGEIFEQEQSMRNASSPAASDGDAAPSSSGSPTVREWGFQVQTEILRYGGLGAPHQQLILLLTYLGQSDHAGGVRCIRRSE